MIRYMKLVLRCILMLGLVPGNSLGFDCKPSQFSVMKKDIYEVIDRLRWQQGNETRMRVDLLLRLRKPLTDAISLARKIGLDDKQIKGLIDQAKQTCNDALTENSDLQAISSIALDDAINNCETPKSKDPDLIKKYWIASLEYNRLKTLAKNSDRKIAREHWQKLDTLLGSYPEIDMIDLETKASGETFSRVLWQNLPKDIPPHEINYQNTNAHTWTTYALGLESDKKDLNSQSLAIPSKDGVVKMYNSIWDGRYKHAWIEKKIPDMLTQHVAGRFKIYGEVCKAKKCDLAAWSGKESQECEVSHISDNGSFKATKVLGTGGALFGTAMCLVTGVACIPIAILGVGLAGMSAVETYDSYKKYQSEVFNLEKGSQYVSEENRENFLKRQDELESNATWLAVSTVANPSLIKATQHVKLGLAGREIERAAENPAVREANQALIVAKSEKIKNKHYGEVRVPQGIKPENKDLPTEIQRKIRKMRIEMNKEKIKEPEFTKQNNLSNAKSKDEFADYLPADPKQSEALLDTFIALHRKSKMADYLEDLTASVARKMLNSGDPKLIAKAKAGELDQTVTRDLLVERMKAEGLNPETIRTFKGYREFRQTIQSGPPVDMAFYGSNGHGSLPHLLQIDYAKETLKQGFGNLKDAFSYFSTNRGLKFWNEAFDQFKNNANTSFRDPVEIYRIVGKTLGLN